MLRSCGRDFDTNNGKWVTINGHHVFISEGISLKDAIVYNKNGITRPIDGDTFNAEHFSKRLKDKNLDIESIINSIGDENMKEMVDKAEKTISGKVSTFDKHYISGEGADAVFDAERTALHEKIIDEYIKNNSGKNATCEDGETPSLILLGGRGGSGKSNFDGIVYDRENVLLIDCDKIKEMIPEYKADNRLASVVHDESAFIMKKIVEYAYDNHFNVVIDQTMSSEKASLRYIEQFKGYHTEAHYMFLPPQVSMQRAFVRFRNDKVSRNDKGEKVIVKGKYDGRYVPIDILKGMTHNEQAFDIVKNNVDNWSFYSNYGVEYGEKPILISQKA